LSGKFLQADAESFGHFPEFEFSPHILAEFLGAEVLRPGLQHGCLVAIMHVACPDLQVQHPAFKLGALGFPVFHGGCPM